MKTITLTDDQFDTLFEFVDQKVEYIVEKSIDYQDSEILNEWEDLIDVYTDWCKSQKLPRMSADDLLYGADTQGKLNLNQRNWLETFIEVWDCINQNT